jgi:hypothetical protein
MFRPRHDRLTYDIPVLHVPGNHDVRSGPEAFHGYVGESNWYFDLNGLRIIGLDNASGKFSPEAVAFARKTLTNKKICLVAFHMPPPIGRWGRGQTVMVDMSLARRNMALSLSR